MGKFVDVYSKRTGKKRSVPEHYLTNPRLMAPFEVTPKQRAADAANPPPPPLEPPATDPDTTAASATHRSTETRAPGDKE